MARETVKYDSELIYKLAADLYSDAREIETIYALVGLALGAGLAWLAAHSNGVAIIIAAIVGGLLGRLVAKERAFQLRLRAQLALCNVAIEENTRDLGRLRS